MSLPVSCARAIALAPHIHQCREAEIDGDVSALPIELCTEQALCQPEIDFTLNFWGHQVSHQR